MHFHVVDNTDSANETRTKKSKTASASSSSHKMNGMNGDSHVDPKVGTTLKDVRTNELKYLNGFGNEHSSEALKGAIPATITPQK
jgi:hypothetical protein